MGIEKRRVVVREVLKSLCLNNGWSYAVFWRFHHPNSKFLTMEDAYYEDQMGTFIKNMLLQVHMLGYGIVGNAAFSKTHKWTFAEDYRRDMNSLISIGTREISQDDSEIHSQFSSGMETIVVISVEPHGVVQFGSTHKVLEMIQFVDHTKRLFQDMDNCDELTLQGPMPSNREIDSLSSLFLPPPSYSFSGNVEMINNASSCNYMGMSSSIDIHDIYPFTLDNGVIKLPPIENQLKMATTESPYFQPNELFYNSPQLLIDSPFSFPSTPMQSNLTNTFNSENVIDNNIFENLGMDFEYKEVENIFDDISMRIVNEGGLDFSKEVSECISEQHVGSVFPPRESLFSQLGIDQCFDHVTSEPYSFADSNSGNNRLSLGNKRKRVICLDSQSCGSSFVSQPKKSEESVNVVKKKAKPGSRPKPKDRQQIQDRITELRKLIPNGIKMSIDSLLAQTIKHMFFLESVTKHAENLKKPEAREIDQDNDYYGTWGFENWDHSMVNPVDVKDLRLPGRKQIQILGEEKEFFLEIVNIIQGFGLTILKGMMELREDKIRASFIVESEAKKYVTKQEIYMSLRQQLHQRDLSEMIVANNSVNGVASNLYNNYHQHLLQVPIDFSNGLL